MARDGVAQALGASLEFDEPTWSRIVEFFAARGRTPSDANRRQAMFPRGAEIVGNALGTAPGFHVQQDGAHIFVLPGPPGELQAMFNDLVLPRVTAAFQRPALRMEHFRTIGVGESTVPPIRTFHKLLRIDEQEFMRACSATFKLGIQFDNWGKPSDRYIHPFGRHGKSHDESNFHLLGLAVEHQLRLLHATARFHERVAMFALEQL